MSTVNKAIIIGRLGGDPEHRSTSSGTPVVNMSVATDNRDDETEWHRIVAFGGLAETCDEYLSKGRRVYVEGRIQTREWQDDTGRDRSTTEIVADDVQFLDGSGGSGPAPSGSGGSDEYGGNGIPF